MSKARENGLKHCIPLSAEEEIRTHELLTRLTDKWSVSTLSVLSENGRSLRFSHLRRELKDISQKSLTLTLRHLEVEGLVTRKVYAEVPPRVEYTITDLGRDLLRQIAPIWIWIARNLDRFAAKGEFPASDKLEKENGTTANQSHA